MPDNANNSPQITTVQYEPKKTEWNFTINQNKSSGSANIFDSVKNIFTSDTAGNKAVNNNYKISVSSDAKTLTIEGVCTKKYYTVLIFGNVEDFTKDPSRALLNRAGVCNSERFNFALGADVLPGSTQDGKYYLVVGEQEEGFKVETSNEPQELEIKKIN